MHFQHQLSPLYEVQDVPRCKKDLSGACIESISSRDEWIAALPELLQLCNEASIRNGAKTKSIDTGKPLSLEYIADRLDLDDLLKGYIVRDKATGWIQGFATVTVFTTWQKWFRFDSLADEAGILMYDQECKGLESLHEMGVQCSGDKNNLSWWNERKIDGDGSIAAGLNLEMRDGNINSQGVIWPRVAELALLGGIGCGSWLLKLIIEELEKETSPYNYLVLQATENSVPFYESQGFIRVGAVAKYINKNDNINNNNTINNNNNININNKLPGDVTSPYILYKVNILITPTIKHIGNKLNIKPHEILFFNRRIYNNIKTINDQLKNGITLRIPQFPSNIDPLGKILPTFSKPIKAKHTSSYVKYDGKPGQISKNKLWYTTRDNDSPLKLAKQLGVTAEDICKVNRGTYPSINKRSSLQVGTILRIPGVRPKIPGVSEHVSIKRQAELTKWVGVDDEDPSEDSGLSDVLCYRHWAFSDDPVELAHASYMMVVPLDKQRKSTVKLDRLKELLVESKPEQFLYGYKQVETDGKSTESEEIIDECPKEIKVRFKVRGMKSTKLKLGPFYAYKKPLSSFGEHGNKLSELNITLESRKRQSSVLHPVKSVLRSGERKSVYVTNAPNLFQKVKMKAILTQPLKPTKELVKHKQLFNSVVKLLPKLPHEHRKTFYNGQVVKEGFEHVLEHRKKFQERLEENYEFFFVMTYIPDLQWVRLAPMKQEGVFDSRYPSVEGRDKWVLCPEGTGVEIDVSAKRCIKIKARPVCKTTNADKEQWVLPKKIKSNIQERKEVVSNS